MLIKRGHKDRTLPGHLAGIEETFRREQLQNETDVFAVGYVLRALKYVVGSSLLKWRDSLSPFCGNPALPEQAVKTVLQPFALLPDCLSSAFTGREHNVRIALPPIRLIVLV